MSKLQRKILFIDSSLEDRLRLRRYLTANPTYEYLIWEAETATTGLALQKQIQPDCIVLNYRLADANGLEVLRKLRGSDPLFSYGVIMLANAKDEAGAVECLQGGAQDYLITEKITALSLAKTLEQVMSRARLERTLIEQRNQFTRQSEELTQQRQELVQSQQSLQTLKTNLEELIQKRSEELINANSTLHMQALVLQNMVEGVVVIDNAREITFVNAAFEKMFGYNVGELVGQSAAILYAGSMDESRQVLGGILQNLDIADEWRGEVLNKTKKGVPFIAYARVGRLVVEGKSYFVSIQEDITERKRVEKDLYERERLAHIGSTAVRLTHEIGNRLNGISTSLQLLERQLAKQSTSQDKLVMEIVQDLDDETMRLTAVLRDLRTLATPYQLHRQPTNLMVLIQELVERQERRYELAGIHVNQTVPQTLPLVFADQEKLAQVILNLFDNAVEAMPEGGELTIRAMTSQDHVRIEVGDTGSGVPADVDILEPFVTTKAGGTGLGLTVARQVMAAHEGVLSYTSLPGQGATFTIELPIATYSPQSIETRSPTHHQISKPKPTQSSSVTLRNQKASQ